MVTNFPPITWAIEGILPTGLAILGGPPKMAKSMIGLEFALGVACGGRAMSELACRQGSVLYLSVDNDSERRLRWRCNHILGDTTDTRHLPIEFHTDWPTGEPAIRACQEWVDEERDEHREPLLVVVDTLGKVEPNFEGNGYDNAYLSSTATLSKWSAFANQNNVALLAIHHDRKSNDENDWLNRFTGSRGITATASTLMMIEAKRGENTGHLRITGRDIEADDLELTRSGWSWITMDAPRVPGLRVV
jgi:RecA-family ATPase